MWIVRIPCGYRIARVVSSYDYTDEDRAWFRRPIGGSK